ncbi:nickel-responsive regulator [Afipia sp. P52-10]|jgi:CopG family nickel-responsive transcriptional regulator|uniref:nickel-responsive transcriptional regulator NikR n=1 Tax=Afipia sp. P52-10 TaxID=1429916 RepID=UPI0003DF47C4|nr:nickel-responsive transcriptional regulator NikR [Afipia sp. P52-10]ETR78608.1 nickel-responsive regulator [Afipia sp. P52-10]
MQRITITLDDDLLTAIDAIATERGYQNRSEVIRDLARNGLAQMQADGDQAEPWAGALVYVYDHAARNLSHRLVETAHEHNDIAVATMHVHLDDASCLEITALKGSRGEIQHFADHVIAERGVRYGRVVMIPARERGGKAHAAHTHPHAHSPAKR